MKNTVHPYIRAKELGMGLPDFILFEKPIERKEILKSKINIAKKVTKDLALERDDILCIFVIGSVTLGDIQGWFSDIDMFAIIKSDEIFYEQKRIVDEQPVFVSCLNLDTFKNLLKAELPASDWPGEPMMLHCFKKCQFLFDRGKASRKIVTIINNAIDDYWERESKGLKEFQVQSCWWYCAALEAFKYGEPGTAILRLRKALDYLLRYILGKKKILIRKKLPDNRVLRQLETIVDSKHPIKLINSAYGVTQEWNIEEMLQRFKIFYTQTFGNDCFSAEG